VVLRQGNPIRGLSGHSGYVESVVFRSDGKTLASGSWDNTIRLWDLDLYFMFLKEGKPTPLFFAFAEAAEFFWQVKREGLEFKRNVTPTLYPKEGYYLEIRPQIPPPALPPRSGAKQV
jgi:hypothetical protein